MGWTIYVKDNKDGLQLLKMITREPPRTFSGIVDSIEKASFFAGDSYMVQKKKNIKGTKKIYYTIMQAVRNSRVQPKRNYSENQYTPTIDYESQSMMQALDGDDDEPAPPPNYKEELSRRATEIEKHRQGARPAKTPTKEEIKNEQQYAYDDPDILEEDRLDEFFKKTMNEKD